MILIGGYYRLRNPRNKKELSGSSSVESPDGQRPSLQGFTHVNDALQFSAMQQNNQVTGTWDISSIFFSTPNPSFSTNTAKQGTITGGQITPGHFTLTGTETIDNTCGGPVPTDSYLWTMWKPGNSTIYSCQL